MALKPQDVLVLLKLALAPPASWTYAEVAGRLGLSPAEVHNAVRRGSQSRLFNPEGRRVRRYALWELLAHGVRYVFPAEEGAVGQGLPTAFAHPVFAGRLRPGESYVWLHPEGGVRGVGVAPLYRSAPEAARRDPVLHRALALLDAIRIGKARERELAAELLGAMLGE